MTTTQQILAHIERSREAEKGVTYAPWIHSGQEILAEDEENIIVESPLYDEVIDSDNLDFIATSRTDLPKYREATAILHDLVQEIGQFYKGGKTGDKCEAALAKIAAMLEGKE